MCFTWLTVYFWFSHEPIRVYLIKTELPLKPNALVTVTLAMSTTYQLFFSLESVGNTWLHPPLCILLYPSRHMSAFIFQPRMQVSHDSTAAHYNISFCAPDRQLSEATVPSRVCLNWFIRSALILPSRCALSRYLPCSDSKTMSCSWLWNVEMRLKCDIWDWVNTLGVSEKSWSWSATRSGNQPYNQREGLTDRRKRDGEGEGENGSFQWK